MGYVIPLLSVSTMLSDVSLLPIIGDAPVHSIAASLFLKPEEMHFFQDIGYRHEPFQHCPKAKEDVCACDPLVFQHKPSWQTEAETRFSHF